MVVYCTDIRINASKPQFLIKNITFHNKQNTMYIVICNDVIPADKVLDMLLTNDHDIRYGGNERCNVYIITDLDESVVNQVNVQLDDVLRSNGIEFTKTNGHIDMKISSIYPNLESVMKMYDNITFCQHKSNNYINLNNHGIKTPGYEIIRSGDIMINFINFTSRTPREMVYAIHNEDTDTISVIDNPISISGVPRCAVIIGNGYSRINQHIIVYHDKDTDLKFWLIFGNDTFSTICTPEESNGAEYSRPNCLNEMSTVDYNNIQGVFNDLGFMSVSANSRGIIGTNHRSKLSVICITGVVTEQQIIGYINQLHSI
jgi:hypothetical protein